MNRVIRLLSRHHEINTDHFSQTNKLVMGSILGAIAAILQSAGLIAGVGFVFSTLATGPIILATILSVRIGSLTYVLTALLLSIIQPTEILVFLFTTGLLGIGIGLGFKYFEKRALVTGIGGISLTVGLFLLLTLFHFPILGPEFTKMSMNLFLGILAFSVVFSWLWVRVSLISMKYLSRVVVRDMTDYK
ncbi:hypothetical protein [Neobacillus sp. Marseille-QA0830]